MIGKNKAQSTLEYAAIIVVVMAALLAIKFYMERGVKGKLRDSGDKIGEQYSAGYTTYKYIDSYTPQSAKEQLNTTPSTVTNNRISRYQILIPAQRTHSPASAATTEQVTRKFKDESLFE
jgi:hypothetical protein